MAELFYALAVAAILVYIISQIVRIIRKPEKGRRVYITILTLIVVCLLFWAAYSYLWTPYYYAPSFAQQADIDDGAVSTPELEAVTRYFAGKANQYAGKVSRDENGVYAADRQDILNRAAAVYAAAAGKWPFLAGDALRPKGILCSKVMDGIRGKYGFESIRRAAVVRDRQLGVLNAKDEHTVHLTGFVG